MKATDNKTYLVYGEINSGNDLMQACKVMNCDYFTNVSYDRLFEYYNVPNQTQDIDIKKITDEWDVELPDDVYSKYKHLTGVNRISNEAIENIIKALEEKTVVYRLYNSYEHFLIKVNEI